MTEPCRPALYPQGSSVWEALRWGRDPLPSIEGVGSHPTLKVKVARKIIGSCSRSQTGNQTEIWKISDLSLKKKVQKLLFKIVFARGNCINIKKKT